MFTMIFISSAALLVGIVGSIVIWRMDARRAEEIYHPAVGDRRALSATGQSAVSIAAPIAAPRLDVAL